MFNFYVYRLFSVYGRYFNISRVGYVKVIKEVYSSDVCK